MAFEVFCQSVTGKYHVREKMSCEDFGLTHKRENSGYKDIAVADGLGD